MVSGLAKGEVENGSDKEALMSATGARSASGAWVNCRVMQSARTGVNPDAPGP